MACVLCFQEHASLVHSMESDAPPGPTGLPRPPPYKNRNEVTVDIKDGSYRIRTAGENYSF